VYRFRELVDRKGPCENEGLHRDRSRVPEKLALVRFRRGVDRSGFPGAVEKLSRRRQLPKFCMERRVKREVVVMDSSRLDLRFRRPRREGRGRLLRRLRSRRFLLIAPQRRRRGREGLRDVVLPHRLAGIQNSGATAFRLRMRDFGEDVDGIEDRFETVPRRDRPAA